MNTEDILNEILAKVESVMQIKTGDIPNIDLYMDQVTTFMDEKLCATVRKGEAEEHILTKTMINNYAKNDLLPPPVKKKYSKEHMMVLIFVYYFKSFMTISDIQEILNPLTEKYFAKGSEPSLEDIYREVFTAGDMRLVHLKEDLTDKYEAAQETFPDASEEDAEFLRMFSYICFLSYDIFVKKMLVERLVDEVVESKKREEERKKEEVKKKKSKEKDNKESEEVAQ